jgi:hypothetical protein
VGEDESDGDGEADGDGVGETDGAGDGDGEAGGDDGEPEPEPEPEPGLEPEPEPEPAGGRERAMRPVGAVAEIHGRLGEPNTGGEVRAWGFDLTVTSGMTDCSGAAANGVAPAAVAECPACGLSTLAPNTAPPANTARAAAPAARA